MAVPNYAEEARRKALAGEKLTDPSNKANSEIYNNIRNRMGDTTTSRYAGEAVRKANAGVKLADPSNKKNVAIYNRANDMGSNDVVEVVKSLENDKQQPSGISKGSGDQVGNASSLGFMDDLRGAYDASVDSQTADLAKLRDKQLADLEKTYVDAVSRGEMSLRDAQQAFEQRAESINQNVYQNSEATKTTATQRGIGNSQQMLGMMASDQSRANNIRNTNMTERDQRVANIKDRISTITQQRNIEGNRINSDFDSGVLKAKSGADMAYLNQSFQVGHEDFRANRDFGFQNQLMDKQQGFDIDKMGISQRYDLDKMATNQQYNMQTLAKQHSNSINQMVKQYGLRDSLNSRQATRDLNNYISKREADVEAKLDAYKLQRDRELAKYEPGTDEYKIVQGQMQNEIGQMLATQEAKTIQELQIQGIIEGTDINTPYMNRPQPGMFGNIDPNEESQYKAKIDAYNRYAEMMGYDTIPYEPFDYNSHSADQVEAQKRRLNQPGW